MVDITTHLARWSQTLVGIAQTGLAFSNSPYDVERYAELLKLGSEMSATLNAQAEYDPMLAAKLEQEWRRQVKPGFDGYVTPKVSVGAIVFNDRDQLLLVYSAFLQNWCFPGGMADIGYPPSAVVRKEVREEAGLEVTPLHLISVTDSFESGFYQNAHIYNLLFYCQVVGEEPKPQTAEILEAAFFDREHLPQPLCHNGRAWLERVFAWHNQVPHLTFFD